jgi:hypothetical protein
MKVKSYHTYRGNAFGYGYRCRISPVYLQNRTAHLKMSIVFHINKCNRQVYQEMIELKNLFLFLVWHLVIEQKCMEKKKKWHGELVYQEMGELEMKYHITVY